MCLDQEYLLLRHTTESVTKITKKFIEKALFCPEYASFEQVQMSQYLSMLKTETYEFVSTQQYQTLFELQFAA